MRDSWRLKGRQGTSARFWLTVRRTTATLVALALIGAFLYLVLRPFFLPRTYLVFMTSGQHKPGCGEPIDFAFEDFQALTALEPALARRGGPPLVFSGVESPSRVREQLAELDKLRLRRFDCLILYIVAHGTVNGGEPYLKCANYSLEQPDQGLYRVGDLLEQLGSLPPKAKLLILDCGREEPELTSATPAYAFPRVVEQMVRDLGDPSLSVLLSNSSWERSHVSPALRQSVFGYMLSRGLTGAADADGDRQLDLSELFQFVRSNVSRWVERATDAHDSQTPLLFRFPSNASTPLPVLLSLQRLANVDTEDDVRSDIEAAQNTDDTSMLANVGNFIVGVSGQFGIPSPNQIKARTRPLWKLAGKLTGGDEETADEGNATEADGSEAAEAVEADAGSAELDWDHVAARRLSEAWILVSRIENRNGASPLPIYAPHLWERLLDELLWLNHLHESGAMADQQFAARQLQQSIAQLRFLAGDDVSTPKPDSLAAQMAAATPPPPLELDAVQSLGLAAALGTVLPDELKEFITAFDQALEVSAPDTFNELIQSRPDLCQQYSELWLALDLRSRSDIPWDARRLALQTRRQAELAAAEFVCAEGWFRDDLESADRLRWEAERLMQSQAEGDWPRLARDNLTQAMRRYQNIRVSAQTVRDAVQLRNRVLRDSHSLLRLHQMARGDSIAGAPQPADLIELFDAVAELDDSLNSAQRNASEVAQRLEQLRFVHQRIAAGLGPAAVRSLIETPLTGNAWRLDVLMHTTLLDAPDREAAQNQLVKLSSELDSSFQLAIPRSTAMAPEPVIGDATWLRVRTQLELECRLAGLAGCPPETARDQLFAALPLDQLPVSSDLQVKLSDRGFSDMAAVADATVNDLAAALGQENAAATALREQARWLTFRSTTARLADFHRALPEAIVAATTSQAENPDVHRARLKAAARDLNLIRVNTAELAAVHPLTKLRTTDWQDLLAWHSQRFLEAAEDATPSELARLHRASDRYERLVAKLTGQSAPVKLPSSGIELATESELLLDSRDGQDMLDVHVQSKSSQPAPIWLVLQYDSNLLRVGDVPGVALYHEHELRSRLKDADPGDSGKTQTAQIARNPTQFRAYPYRPDLFALPPTLQLGANQLQSLSIPVRRVSGARGQATFVVKALGAGSFSRQTGLAQLPGHQMFRLLVADPVTLEVADATTWTATAGGVRLHPYPNREQAFVLQLQDLANRGGEVHVELSIPSRSLDFDLPEGALQPAALEEILRLVGSREIIGQATLQLSPGAATVIPFPRDDKQSPVNPAPPSDPSDSKTPTGTLLRHGLFMVITDSETQLKTLRRIQFAAQRTRRYLNAHASYDASSQRLTVDVEAPDPKVIPTAGMMLELSFAEPLDNDQQARLKRRLTPANRHVQLFTQVPLSERRNLTAWLTVDGYPRAFVFNVPCTDTMRDIPPMTDLREVRVVAPSGNSAYASAGLSQIPVRIEVDAPWAAFSEAGVDFVQVGIDSDQDLDLQEEDYTLRLAADRQVELYLRSLLDNGTLSVYADVDDFDLELPVVGLDNQRAYVLAPLVTGNTSVLSRGPDRPPVEIVIDGSGPTIPSLDFSSSRRLVVGSKVSAFVTAVDRWTRVVKVEVGFDELGAGDFSGVKQPIEAKPSDGGKMGGHP